MSNFIFDQSDLSNLHCPSCSQTIPSNARICPHCKSNQGVAAIKETRCINTAVSNPTPFVSPEILFPRIGEYLFKKGLVSQEELKMALAQQEELSAKGETKLLGQILIGSGIIEQAELDSVITEQMLYLKSSLEESNKQLESHVAQRTKKLEQAMARLGQLEVMKNNFVANVTHELRTPLFHLVGNLDLLLNEYLGPLATDQKSAVSSMTRASKRLWTLIEDLLLFSAMATDNIVLAPNPFPITEPIEQVISQRTAQATTHQILLHTRINSKSPFVYADQKKITWVVDQLLDNAIKFTPPEGRVVAYAQQNGDKVQVNIIDTGIGIPEDRINELFSSFHQLEEYSTRHHEGMGLGLTTAQKILEAHGSTIQVTSRVGVGSHFSFSLPSHN